MSFDESILIEITRAGLNLAALVFGWIVGQRILISWDRRKKRQDIDLTTSVEFDALYGQFKECAKLWRIFKRPVSGSIEFSPNTRWNLLMQACAAESKCEAILLKLASERKLNQDEILVLGLFRQGIQQLRESIRDDCEVPSSSRGPQYILFNQLAAGVAAIIREENTAAFLSSACARENLRAIAVITLEHYSQAVERVASQNPEIGSERIVVGSDSVLKPKEVSVSGSRNS